MRLVIISKISFLHFTSEVRPECVGGYTVLDSQERNIKYATNSDSTWFCDGSISTGWYRFWGDAGTQLPTSCVQGTTQYNLKCRTHGVSWLNGTHPSVSDGKVTREVCFSYDGECCHRSRKNIEVINCGWFYIYKLGSTPWCNSRYCGTDVWWWELQSQILGIFLK